MGGRSISFKEDFIKSYDENSGKGSFPEVDDHRLILKKVHRAIQFNQKVLLKSYIEIWILN